MEKQSVSLRGCMLQVSVLWMILFVGCQNGSAYSMRASRVPIHAQLPAVEPIPEGLNPRRHPALPVITQFSDRENNHYVQSNEE